MATIENLPLELIDNPIAEEPSIFKNLNETDIIKCSEVLIGSIHEEYVTQKFLRPQLNVFATLDLNLKESLRNEGWFEECEDTKLIIRLWKEFKPLKGMNYLIIQLCSGASHYILLIFRKKCYMKC